MPSNVASEPGPVRNMEISAKTATSFTVEWDAPSSNGGRELTGYGVRWAMAGDPTHQKQDVDRHTTSLTVSGLSAGQTYAVSVQACNGTRAAGRGPTTKT